MPTIRVTQEVLTTLVSRDGEIAPVRVTQAVLTPLVSRSGEVAPVRVTQVVLTVLTEPPSPAATFPVVPKRRFDKRYRR